MTTKFYSANMTTDLCLNHCKTNGMKLSFLWRGYNCACSNTMVETSTSNFCNKPCTGKEGTQGQCGG